MITFFTEITRSVTHFTHGPWDLPPYALRGRGQASGRRAGELEALERGGVEESGGFGPTSDSPAPLRKIPRGGAVVPVEGVLNSLGL